MGDFWFDIIATVTVLLLAGCLLGAMFFFIRIASDDSEKHKALREFVETLFATPAHLRQDGDASNGNASSQASSSNSAALQADRARSAAAAYREPCPACGEEVTEKDAICPSCELRLL